MTVGWRPWALPGIAVVGAGLALVGCAPKAYVRHEVRAEMRTHKEKVEALRQDVSQDAARSAESVAGIEQRLLRQEVETRTLRVELTAVRQLLVAERLEAQGEADRMRLEMARLHAALRALDRDSTQGE